MLRKAFIDKIGTAPKVALVNVILVANALIWYFYSFSFLMEVVNGGGFSNIEILSVWGVNLFGIAAAALLGTSLIYRVKNRISFIFYWMLIGVFLSLIPIAVNISGFPTLLIFSTLVGAYFGAGMPACLGYYASSTETGNRSRLAGIIFLTVFLGFFLLGVLGIQGAANNSLILAASKAIGLVVLFLLKPDEKKISADQKVSFGVVIRNRSFLLYFGPWCLFLLVNYMAAPIVSQLYPAGFFRFSSLIEQVLSGFVAVACGFFADFIGRKRLTVAGFALLGLGYASLGVLSGNIIGWWFYTVVDGIAWGIFYTIFLITLWGDIAQERSSERYYAIGSLPFLFSNFIRLSLGSYVAANIQGLSVFSFASLFLFLAVLPLVYAPETLPETNVKQRDLSNYLEKAKRFKEKYA